MPDSPLGQVPRKVVLPGGAILRPVPNAEQISAIGRQAPGRGRFWRRGGDIAKVIQTLLQSHDPLDVQALVQQGFDFSKFLQPEIPALTLNSFVQRSFSFNFTATTDVLTTATIAHNVRANAIMVIQRLTLTTLGLVNLASGGASVLFHDQGGGNKHSFVTEPVVAGATPSVNDARHLSVEGPFVMLPGDRITASNGYNGPGAGANLQTIIGLEILQFPLGYNGWCGGC